MAFNPLALLGGLQGFVSKNEETSNKINAMKQQGLEFQDMLRQRQRTQERENVVNAQQDAMHALNLAQAQRADEIAKLMQGYYKQAAPNEGQALVDTSLLNAGVVKHNLNNQPRLFKLDDLDLTHREQMTPLEQQFNLGNARFNLSQQPTMQSVAAAGLANQGRELQNAWMRPSRAAYYKAQTDYANNMAIANNKTTPYPQRMKAWQDAQVAYSAGQQALAEAASEAKIQGVPVDVWRPYFQQDPAASNFDFSKAFPNAGKGIPIGTLNDPSVAALFDTLGTSANSLFDPLKDLTETFPSIDDKGVVTDGRLTLNNSHIGRYLATGFMPQISQLAYATGNDVNSILSQWSGVPNIQEGTHYNSQFVPPQIMKNGKLVANPLHVALTKKLAASPLTKDQQTAIQNRQESFDKRLATLAGLFGSTATGKMAEAEKYKAATAMAQAGWQSFSTAMQKKIDSLQAIATQRLKEANVNAEMLETLIPKLQQLYNEGKLDKQAQAALSWVQAQTIFGLFIKASQNPGKQSIQTIIDEMNKEEFKKMFQNIAPPPNLSDTQIQQNGGTPKPNTEPPNMTGNAGGSGAVGSIRLRPRN